jgi:hypothetical protein
MRRALRWTGLLLALVLAVPAPAADKNTTQASEQDYSSLPQNGDVIGKLKSISPTDKTLTLEIDVSLLQPKNGAGTNAARLMEQQERILREEQDILRTRNPVQRAQKMQRLAAELERDQLRNQNNVRTVTQHKDFDLESTADAKVRTQDPPVQYDEKGNVKKYTSKELQDLKGDSKLPGYTSDWDSLKVGQTVKVTLTRPKVKADDKDNNNKDKDKKTDTRPRASVVLVIKDAPDADAPGGKKK